MKKKLLMMFCGALSAVASVNCNGAPADTDYGRGSNLGTNHFDIYPVFTKDPAKKFAESKIYELIPQIARAENIKVYTTNDGSNPNNVTKIPDADLVDWIFKGKAPSNSAVSGVQPAVTNQGWLDKNNECIYANVKAMVELLDLGFDKNLVTLDFCKADIGTFANPTYGLVFKDESQGGIGKESNIQDTDKAIKMRILKILFEVTLDVGANSRAAMALGVGAVSDFIKQGGVIDESNKALEKIKARFKAMKNCYDNFFVIAECLKDICMKLNKAVTNIQDPYVTGGIDLFIDTCKCFINGGNGYNVDHLFNDGGLKNAVPFERVLGYDSITGAMCVLYSDINKACLSLIDSINKSKNIERGENTDTTVKVLNNLHRRTGLVIINALPQGAQAFSGSKLITEIVTRDRFYSEDDTKATFCSELAKLAVACNSDGLKLADEAFGTPAKPPANQPGPATSPAPVAPQPATTLVMAPASVSSSGNAISKSADRGSNRPLGRRTLRNRRRRMLRNRRRRTRAIGRTRRTRRVRRRSFRRRAMR